MQHAERELLEPVLLCDEKGLLNPDAIGYARTPFITSNLKGHFLKKKRWNYWCIYGEDLLFSATIAHLDYKAVCLIYVLDYETQRFCEKQLTIPIGRRVRMPEEVLESIKCVRDDISIQFVHIQGETHLSVTIPDFENEILHADLHIIHPEKDESLNVVIPKSRDTFQFTSKHAILPTGGFVKIGERRYDFNPYYSFAVHDFGRGVWPKLPEWNWAMASQRTGGKRVGLNFGGKWTDGTGMTENAVFIENTMYKIHEDVLFSTKSGSLMDTWRIQTKFSRDIRLTFQPFFQRRSPAGYVGRNAEAQQFVGYFNGVIHLPNDQVLPIRQMLGSVFDQSDRKPNKS